MPSDLTKWLRERQLPGLWSDTVMPDTLCVEAATEIERLEAANVKLLEDSDSYKASMKQYFEQSLSEHNAKVAAQAEVERLREALMIAEAVLRHAPDFETTDDGRLAPMSPKATVALIRTALSMEPTNG